MTEYDQILKVKEDAEARLRTLPGVHAVGIGKKVVAGKPNDELSIVVFLVEKKPLDRLPPEEVIPAEIDGVLTDVVEMEMPRLVSVGVNDLKLKVAQGGKSVTLTGNNEILDNGIGVVLFYTPSPSGSPSNVYAETRGNMTKGQLAVALADALTAAGFPASSDPLLSNPLADGTVRLETTACILTNFSDPIACDNHKYSKDYLRGGIRIQVRGSPHGEPQIGTLGCLATLASTPDAPQGKVVAITCHHVVAGPERNPRNLGATWRQQGNQIAFTTGAGNPPVLAGTVVILRLFTSKQSVVYSTLDGETATDVAGRVASAVTQLHIKDVGASNGSPPTPTVTVSGETVEFLVIYGPAKADEESDLHAKVGTTTAPPGALVIDFTGKVSDDTYGIFINVNIGGPQRTFGVFFHPKKGMATSDIASSIEQAINAVSPDLRRTGTVQAPGPLVTASSKDAQVKVLNAQEVECIVKSVDLVGQPTDNFCCRCSHCCNDLIGHVIESRVDLDVALVQVDSGLDYKPVIEGINGLVTGTYDLKPGDEHTLRVSKRGRTSGVTHGIVERLHVSGEAEGRLYVDAVTITVDDPDPKKQYFCLPGDSGAAVLKDNQVAGIVFGQSGPTGLITPISQILTAFPSLNVAPAPAPGKAPDAVRTVPKTAMSAVAPLAPLPATTAGFLGRRLAEVRSEVEATPAGSEVAAAIERHFAETHRLVTGNRRVAAVWRRSGGPQIVQAVLDLAQRRDRRLPEEIDGKPFALCLERIKNALARYASPALAADLARFGPLLLGFSGLTYAQMLGALRSGGAE